MKSAYHQSAQQGGANLLEMLAVVAILSLMQGIFLPGYQQWMDAQQQAASLNRPYSIIEVSRHQAALRGEALRLCPSADGVECLTQPAASQQLLLLDPQSQLERTFFISSGAIAFPAQEVWLPAPPERRLGASLRVCTRFDRLPSRGVVMSATGRPRLGEASPSLQALENQCF